MKCTRNIAAQAVVICGLALAAGCGPETQNSYSRLHFQNESGSSLSFLAIEVSEAALSTAENRLSRPLEPNSVYSAVLSRPGNYWVRTEIETEGYVIERIEGPVRITRGVSDWRFAEIDAQPLYVARKGETRLRNPALQLNTVAAPQLSAARMSFKSN